MLKTPVAFFIFNRPDTTQRVFETIRQAKPLMLLIVADGARLDRSGEAEKCAVVRAIVEQIDWDCQVLTNFSETNLGCKRRIFSGLDWVFSFVEEAIILEDDCLPHPSFFRFCEELLAYYRNDKRVMAISGNNFQFGRKRTQDSYYFSRYNHCWGWASWRRAWQYYDVEMKLWPLIKQGNWLEDLLQEQQAIADWGKRFESVYTNQLDTWDYQWTFACWLQSSLTILPNVNLVSNIGFSAEATHTNNNSPLANLPIEAIVFPLCHPGFVIRDARADTFTQKHIFQMGLISRLKQKLKKELLWSTSINSNSSKMKPSH
jgi:hypothetical protein